MMFRAFILQGSEDAKLIKQSGPLLVRTPRPNIPFQRTENRFECSADVCRSSSFRIRFSFLIGRTVLWNIWNGRYSFIDGTYDIGIQ